MDVGLTARLVKGFPEFWVRDIHLFLFAAAATAEKGQRGINEHRRNMTGSTGAVDDSLDLDAVDVPRCQRRSIASKLRVSEGVRTEADIESRVAGTRSRSNVVIDAKTESLLVHVSLPLR